MMIFVVTDNPWWLEKATILFKENNIAADFYCSEKGENLFENEIQNGKTKPINLKEDVESLISKYTLGFSVHCKQIFPEKLVESVRCINIHPGLNPHNRGWFPQIFSIINKKPIGATIHIMDKEIDHGHILYQQEVKIRPWDTSRTVYDRVLETEFALFSENLSAIIYERYIAIPMLQEGNYNSIADYRALTKLDLDRQMRLGDAIDLLRAMTHTPYKNAYFLQDDGSKVFVSVDLQLEKNDQ